MIPVHPHPEWKRAYEEIAPKLSPGQLWTYPMIRDALGIEARSNRGRRQFLRCRDEILKKTGWFLENVINKGYRVVDPNDQSTSAVRVIGHGKRRIRKGLAINGHAKRELMTSDAARVSVDLQARATLLDRDVTDLIRLTRKDIGAAELKRLPSPLAGQDLKP
jgi:hypothetical protein